MFVVHFALKRAAILYGPGKGDILLDNIQCTGNESSLLHCSHNGILQHNCSIDHTEDAGVICGGI